METPPDSPTSLGQRIARGFLALVGVIILYALSSGPIFALGLFHPRVNRLLSPVYEPLLVAAMMTGLEIPLANYINWWVELSKPPMPPLPRE